MDTVTDLFSIITTLSVLRELENFARHEDRLGIIAKRVLLKRNRFFLKEAAITDDLKLLRHTTGKIKRGFSTYFLTDFVYAGMFTKEEALVKLEEMRDIRDWQENIIYLSTKGVLENIED